MKKLEIVICCILLVLITSCSSNSEDLINEIVNTSPIPSESAELGDAKADKNEYITPMPAYDGLPEVTIDPIPFDKITFRTFEEFMEQNPPDDTPYKCQWEKTEDVADVPDENIILWAVPGSGDYSASEEDVNGQLRKDGYPFRMKIVTIPDDIYCQTVENSDADIIFTGSMFAEDVYYPAYKVVRGETGKYLKLDEYLEGSKLWEHCPQIDWDSVEYKGAHYVVPNYALCGETGLQIRIKKSSYAEEEIAGFDGTLDTLLPLISKDRKLFYGITEFRWLLFEGINYVAYTMYYDENGNIRNVMDLDINIRWIRELNRMFREGMAIESSSAEASADEWSIALTDISDKNRFNEDDYYIYTFPGNSNSFYNNSLAIRSTSKNPDMAFKLMELIITDRTYANLMAYGGTPCVDKDGFMVDPVTGEGVDSGMRRFYFGIEDNISRPLNERWSFDSSKDRADYVSKYIRKIDYKIFDHPDLLYLSGQIYGKYIRIIPEIRGEREFNQTLAEYIAESREAFKILE